jgi:hypothetical protein
MKLSHKFGFANPASIQRIFDPLGTGDRPQNFRRLKQAPPNLHSFPFFEGLPLRSARLG